jgi:hypothetical protein
MSHPKYLGYIALERRTQALGGRLKLVSSQGARFVSINKQISYFERDNPAIEAFRGFEICGFLGYLLHRVGETCEDHVIR